MSRTVELAKDAVPAVPAVAVAASHTFFGYTLADWASWMAIIYGLLIILNQLRKNWVPWIASKPWTRRQWWK